MSRLFIVSGPSGVGKSTLCRKAAAADTSLVLSVSATTRPPRPGEVDGADYHFVDHREFERMRAAGELLEWAEVHGNSYGTPRRPVEEALAAGCIVLLEIDVQGARQVKSAMPDAVTVFVLAPTWETLERRLERRRTEGPDAVARRLRTALKELAAEDEFDRRMINDELDESVGHLLRIIHEHTERGDTP